MYRLSFITLVTLLTSHCAAWGALGHQTIALIAQTYITPQTKSWAQSILGNSSTTLLADVSTWADSYRSTKAGKFSAPYHYIDAEDAPPKTCGVDLNRDCAAGGCVVTAIANYTARLQETRLPKQERTDALKFLIHFIGDIHQPLHTEALQVGGNKIEVKFDGKKTNLHAAWDTSIPQKIVGGGKLSDAEAWAVELSSQIRNGVYASAASSWLSDMLVNDGVSSAMVWARDSNALVCSAVVPAGETSVTGQEIGGAYHDSVVRTVELQIAKAGYRLGAWLNLLATGNTGGLKVKKSNAKRQPLSCLPKSAIAHNSRAKLARRAFGDSCHDHEH